METLTNRNAVESPAHVTDDREAHSLHWYAARTQMNCEHKVERRFQDTASEVYLPTQVEVHQWSDRKKKVLRKVIPMILFVKIKRTEALKLQFQRDSQFYGFITKEKAGHIPAEIPDDDIEMLRYMLKEAKYPVTNTCQDIKVGNTVQIARGALKGIEGVVQVLNNGTVYLIVDMGLLGFVQTEIDPSDCMIV